jgi:hypothetical protein
VGTVPVRLSEGTLGLRLEANDATLSLGATVRRDPDAARILESGLSATAVFWQSASRAFVISAVRQLPDFERGVDAVQLFSIAMRLNEPTPDAARTLRTRPTLQVTGLDSTRVVRVRAPGARRVELMGDFTEWEPIELVPSDGEFSRTVALSSGTHRVVVRIDGGPWVPAANTPAVDDDFGGRVGLLVVP